MSMENLVCSNSTGKIHQLRNMYYAILGHLRITLYSKYYTLSELLRNTRSITLSLRCYVILELLRNALAFMFAIYYYSVRNNGTIVT